MKRLMVLATMAGALSCAAADQTLTYTAADKPATLGTGGELAFTYDGDTVTKIVSNVAKGDTVYLKGDTLAFGTDATVETAGLGDLVISNAISGTSGLLVTNTSPAQLTMEWWGDNLLHNVNWTTVFENVDLDCIELVSSDEKTWGAGYGVSLSNPQMMYPFWEKRTTVDGVKTMTAQLQCYVKSSKVTSGLDVMVKYAKLELRQEGANVAARVTDAGYIATNSTFDLTYIKETVYRDDIEVLRTRWLADPDPSVNPRFIFHPVKLPGDTGAGYGVGQLTVRRTDVPSVSFNYKGSRTYPFGGDLKIAANARARRLRTNGYNPASGDSSTIDVAGIWENGDFTGSQGVSMKGNGTYAVVAETLGHENPYEGRIAKFLTYRTNHVDTATANGNQGLTHSIFDMTNICSAIMCGGSMTLNQHLDPSNCVATPHHWRFYTNGPNSYATVQMQASNNTTMIRCTILKFMQNKPDSFYFGVSAITNLGCYTPFATGTNKGDGYYGMDFEAPDVANTKGFYKNYTKNSNENSASPFSVSNLVCQFSRPGEYFMSINATNPNWQAGRLVVAGKPDGTRVFANVNGANRLPQDGTVEVRMGGTLNMGNGSSGPGISSQNNSVTIRVHRGGILRTYPSVLTSASKWAYRKGQRIDLLGGEMLPSWLHYPTTKLCYCYLNNTIFADGARIESDIPFWAGNADSNEAGRWLVRGEAPSYIDSPIMFLDKNHVKWEFPIDVADVTGDDGSDFYLLKDFTWCDKVSAGGSTDFDKVELGKYGPGTLEARGRHLLQIGYKINIYGGAWKLGASHITDDMAQGFKLSGGTLEAAENTVNSCGPLAITERGGKIKLGADATLTFADSSAETWPRTVKVMVEGFEEGAIRFNGNAVPRRMMFQLADGTPLRVKENGYLTASIPGTNIAIR